MFKTRYVFLAVFGFLAGCCVSPEQLSEWAASSPLDGGQSVRQVAPPPISDPNDLDSDSPARQAPIRVRLSNPTPRDADCHVTMELTGQEVHFSFRRILAATESLVIGPDQADIVRIEATFLGEPPAAMEPRELRIDRGDFAPGDIIDFVLALPPLPPTIAIEGLDADLTVNPGDLVTFDIVTQNAPAGARVGASGDPDDDPDNGNELSILDDAPAADRTSVAWDTTEVPPGTYAVYAELRDGDEVVRFGPAPGRVIVESPPPPPEGACCFADGTCELLTADACSLSGGEYQGDFTGCDPNPCLPPWGACCFLDGTCQEFTAEECVVAGGEYQGDFVPCDPNPCPPLGACCYPDGTCEIILEAQCLEGEWLGPDTTCDMCPCVVICPVDASIEDEPCGEDTNGGCNMADPQFEPITCGETICGTIWADDGVRDTDWFEVMVTEDTELTFTVEAEFNGLGVIIGFLAQFEPGIPDCDNLTGELFPFATGAECEVISVTQCVSPGTYYLFVSALDYFGLPCDSNNDYVATLTCQPCAIPRGACCLGDAVCDVLTADQCSGMGGDYQGDGTDCDPNPCLPVGACCLSDGTCLPDLTAAECTLLQGTYWGDDTTCEPNNPCPQPVGACCLSDGSCLPDLTEAECTVLEGTYWGDETTCVPNPCPEPGDNCDNPLVVTVPSGLPYSDMNTTCGRGNDYIDTCLSPYDAGEDIIYELIVTATTTIQITVDPKGMGDTGVALAGECPPTQCIAVASDPLGKLYSTGCHVLDPGTYYVMVDSATECIGSFVLTIAQCE